MATLKWDVKDPQENLDYSLTWEKELSRLNDTIFGSVWRIEDGDGVLVMGSDGINGYITYIWLSAGTPGETYKLVNTITTDEGRIYERTVILPLAQR